MSDATQPPRLETWEYAGLMLTYWCNARCAFCYVYSGPDRGGELSIEDAVRLWGGLDRLPAAHGRRMRIHLAGGEPFGDWPRLLGIVRAARDAGLTPLEKVETNGYWAVDDDLTRARLEALDALGMEKLVVSADVYHQEFVPIERVRRLVETARRVLGRGRVRVRWWEHYNEIVAEEPAGAGRATRIASYRAALARHADRLAGRAALRLGDYFERFPAEHFRGQHCVEEVLHSRHVHVDPYGFVFPGVCAGIILGNALREPGGIEGVWNALREDWPRRPVIEAVVRGGSHALFEKARALGYRERREGYANKCHLCSDVRQFLSDRGIWPEDVGPAECYANARDQAEAERDAAAGFALPLLPARAPIAVGQA